MKKFTKILVSALVLGVGLMISMPNASAQQDKKENTPNYRLISMAMDLADYGYDNQSALALAQAAEILIDNPVKSANCKDSATNKPLPAIPGAHDYSPKALLNKAKEYAGTDEAALAYINTVEKSANTFRTRASSKATAVYQDIYIAGNDYEIFYEDVPDLSNVELWVTESDASLCLYVYNALGQLKDSDCRTNPSTDSYYAFSQRIQIKLVNRSSYGTSCRIWFQGYYL